MIMLHCSPERDYIQKTTYSCGRFSYTYEADFAKNLPEALSRCNVAGGCTDPEGNVYLAMRGPGQIVKLDSDGNFVKCFGKELLENYIHFIYYHPEHKTIICTDTMNSYILEFDTDGKLFRQFGIKGKASDTGTDPDRLVKCRRDGKLYPPEPYFGIKSEWAMFEMMRHVSKVGEPFNKPTDAGLTSDGKYVFADGYGNRAVHIFDRDGRYEHTFGGVGDWETPYEDTPGKMLVVHALCVDAMDRIWVCDREKDAVHIFDTQGNVIGYCSGSMGAPSGVDTDGKYIYVAGRCGYLTIFDMNMDIVAQLGTFNSDLRAHDIAADRNGNLFLFPTHANEDHQVIKLHRM